MILSTTITINIVTITICFVNNPVDTVYDSVADGAQLKTSKKSIRNMITLSSFFLLLLYWCVFTGRSKCGSKTWLLLNGLSNYRSKHTRDVQHEDNYHKQLLFPWLFKKHRLNSNAFEKILEQTWEILMIISNIFSFLFFFSWLNMYVPKSS